MKTVMAILAIIMMICAPVWAEMIIITDSSGRSTMLDVDRTDDSIQIRNLSDGGLIMGDRQGGRMQYRDIGAGKTTWIDGDSDQDMPLMIPGK
jgi:hypothetical protein